VISQKAKLQGFATFLTFDTILEIGEPFMLWPDLSATFGFSQGSIVVDQPVNARNDPNVADREKERLRVARSFGFEPFPNVWG
jgi:hypothetical protein